MGAVLGVDFGTTNTVLSMHSGDGAPVVLPFAAPEARATAFRSVLSFREHPDPARPRVVEAGPWAIEEYLEDPLDTRFIQSFKSFAASASFQSTDIFSRRYAFEDLLSSFLTRLRAHAGERLEALPGTAVIGRPVQFAGANPDADLALRRYEQAFRRLGFTKLHYVYEPVAAAFYFAQRLTGSAAVLVADFGGGTSDFSVIRFDRRDGHILSKALAHSGVAVAGDAFDYRIIDRVVSPELGKGSSYTSFGKVLPVPARYYAAFARWSQLALLKSSRELRDLRSLSRAAQDSRLERFVELIENDHGYPLYRAVSKVKETLSAADHAPFRFQAGAIDISAEIARTDFESWIAPELAQIEKALQKALDDAGLEATSIDQVFLTGGSSFVPAVRRLFTDRFGEERIASGGEFESIASGLALIGGIDDLASWSETL
ncbi:MAG TPA: Hsp70 family protein [Caulobacteraceae bacterium]|jgi:hypothetical chaperone protein